MSGLILYTTEDGTSRIQLRARRRQDIPMRFWRDNVGQIISSNGFPLPQTPAPSVTSGWKRSPASVVLGSTSSASSRKRGEPMPPQAELAALENKIKRRPKP